MLSLECVLLITVYRCSAQAGLRDAEGEPILPCGARSAIQTVMRDRRAGGYIHPRAQADGGRQSKIGIRRGRAESVRLGAGQLGGARRLRSPAGSKSMCAGPE